jgi:hypothetical protein
MPPATRAQTRQRSESKPKNGKPAASKSAPQENGEGDWPILDEFRKFSAAACVIDHDDDDRYELPTRPPITRKEMETFLGWETLTQYRERMAKEAGGKKKPEDFSFDEEKNCVITDINGEKVCLSKNFHNRDFRDAGARSYAQTILERGWAGPLTMPGETLNGEPIIISRTGRCRSIQHRGVGFIFACQLWAKNPARWADKWPEEPVFETLLVTGVSDSEVVTNTYDNVIARTEEDVLVQSQEFAGIKSKSERRMLCKMMAKAIDLLWSRVKAGGAEGEGKVFKTHSASIRFKNNHAKLIECVKHLRSQDKGGAISKMGLSAGRCAALCYLMGCSADDGNKYRSKNPSERTDRNLDWSNLKEAKEFWTSLVAGDIKNKALVEALKDERVASNKLAQDVVIARAWAAITSGDKMTRDNVGITDEDWQLDQNGIPRFVPDEVREFGGIDCGPKIPQLSGGSEKEKEEQEKEKERILNEKLGKGKGKKGKGKKGKGKAADAEEEEEEVVDETGDDEEEEEEEDE